MYGVTTGVGVIAGFSGAFSVGCMNISAAFIKLFQVIEIMSKFIYLPVWYKGLVLEVFYAFSQIGELINANPEYLAKTEDEFHGLKARYWTKFTLYGEYNNILQSQPITCLALLFLFGLKLFWKICRVMKWNGKVVKCG